MNTILRRKPNFNLDQALKKRAMFSHSDRYFTTDDEVLPDEVTGGDASCFRLSRTTVLLTGDVSDTGDSFLGPD